MKFIDEKKLEDIFGLEEEVEAAPASKDDAGGADWLKELEEFKELDESVNETLDEDGKAVADEANKERRKVEKIAGKFSDMLQKQMEEKGEEGLLRMMIVMQIASEGMIIDFEKGAFEDFQKDGTIHEEDVYRLRRFLREALDARKEDWP